MSKSPEMQAFLDQVTELTFGRKRSQCLTTRSCVFCGRPAEHFRDAISEKEFGISGICSQCQDETFGGPEDQEGE